jgi:DNA-binding transcriptional regulator YdaS (Cro superfamily)
MYRIPILSLLIITEQIQMTTDEALEKAVAAVGSMQSLAEALGVTKGAVSQWKLSGRRVPAEHCPSIERLTAGAVHCEELRPDVDWAFIRAGCTPSCHDGGIALADQLPCAVEKT